MKQFKNILVQVDSRIQEHPVLKRAVELAKSHQAALTVVDVAPEFSWPVRVASGDYNEIRRAVIHEKEQAIEKIVAPLKANGLEVTGKILSGKSSDQVIGEVVRFKHDLVMKDAKGQYSQHPGVFGRTATRLIRYCPCPFWAYRPQKTSGKEKIIAAVDATAEDEAHLALNDAILGCAAAVAGKTMTHVAHVWSVYGESLVRDYMKREEFVALEKDAEREAREQMKKLVASLKPSLPESQVHLLRGDPAQEMIRFVNTGGFDVLILGTVARTGISGFLIGNTAEAVINRVECSVIAVKPANFVTPIHVT